MSLLSKKGVYAGPVVYRDGVHYPADREGKKRHRLLWSADLEAYEYWNGRGQGHQVRYHKREVELELGDN